MKNKTYKLLNFILVPLFIVFALAISYVALFYNDAATNVTIVRGLIGQKLIYVFDAILLLIFVPISLSLMEIITGKFGLERFKRIAAISVGMATLGFAALQFIGAIATSSAEGATVAVEIIQQIAHFSQHGSLEQYGLVGMLTSSASGPWNSSIFPIIILIVWFIRNKQVGMETKQLHIPMLFQWILYSQQFLFGLDLKYTLLEIILMLITGTIFVWGMLSFLVSMFKNAEKAEAEAAELINEVGTNKKQNFYSRLINKIAHFSFSILMFNPFSKKVDFADQSVLNKKGGFGNISRSYVIFNALQLTVAMTIAMFVLVLSVQFIATQLKMSDAEAALFGTAGLTSVPEALVALSVGPYINTLLLVGSNVIDGWMSAIGQTVLLSYAEIASGGTITSIPLHPAIRFLTFLSWTQGMFVWLALSFYAYNIHKVKNKKLLTIISILLLILTVVYYFGGAWFSAQALGYGADYAKNSFVYKTLDTIISFLAGGPTQQISITLNIIGLGYLAFHWTGITKMLRKLIKSESSQNIDSTLIELKNKIDKHLKRENQQVVIILDTSSDMDRPGRFFNNKWIDLVFRQTAALALIFDDDGHIPVYITRGKDVKKLDNLLTEKNSDIFIEKYVGRSTKETVEYAPVLNNIFEEYTNELTIEHDPVLVLFITAGGGTDIAPTMKIFKKMENKPIFVQFLAIFGNQPHKNINILNKIVKDPGDKIDNSGISNLPLFRLTDANQIVEEVLNEYPNYLEKAKKLKFIK